MTQPYTRLKRTDSNCFYFVFRFRFVWATETKALPLVSVGPSSFRRLPRPNSLRSLPAVEYEFLVGKRALTERRPLEFSVPNFILGKFCVISKMRKIQNQKNMHSQNHKNKHSLNKNICLLGTDFVCVTDCCEPMRRIVQIPFEEFHCTIRVPPGRANLFSEGPRGPTLVNDSEFLTPWDPSGGPWGALGHPNGILQLFENLVKFNGLTFGNPSGEPWGATGTLGELDLAIFRGFETVFC